MWSDTHRRGCHTKGVHTLSIEREYTHSAVVCGSSTRSIFHGKSRIGACTTKSYNLLHQQRCRRSRRIYRSQEAEEGEFDNSLKTCTKCRVLNSIVRDARTNFGRQRLRHHYVPVFAERMRRESCQRKWRRELFARQFMPRKDQK